MGSGSSSGGDFGDEDKFGEWKDELSHCKCDSKCLIINDIKWIECDIMVIL